MCVVVWGTEGTAVAGAMLALEGSWKLTNVATIIMVFIPGVRIVSLACVG